jgi:HSP20 family protein
MAEQNLQTKSRKDESTGQARGLQHRPYSSGMLRNDPFLSQSEFFGASPFSLMRRFTENMERAFRGDWETGAGHEQYGMWAPAIDVSERDNKLVVRADLPGTARDDVKVEVLNETLVIQGERRQEHEEQEGGYRRIERRYGSFYRAIPLPDGAQAEQARAEFRDGVLEISVPVSAAQRQRGREVPIETGGTAERKDSASAAGNQQQRVSRAG